MLFAASRRTVLSSMIGLIAGLAVEPASAFTYVTAGGNQSVDTIVHPSGYSGTGGVLRVTLGLHPDFASLEQDFEFSFQQTVSLWNRMLSMTANLEASAEVPAVGGTDIWGTLTHEVGHALGLAHPTLGAQTGVSGQDTNYANSTAGLNGVFDLNAGADGIRGSSDDLRSDDENLNYFKKADNNPLTLPASNIIDSTTYSRNLADLPVGDTYAAISEGAVASGEFSLTDTEGMMVSGGGLVPGLVRRALTADDVAGIRYAMSGLDEIQGTADDYTVELVYVGVSSSADIVVRFDQTGGYAATGISTQLISGNHRRITPGRIINYNPNLPNGRTWYFPVKVPLPIESFVVAGSTVSVSITTEVGKRYGVHWARDLTPNSWSTLGLQAQVNGQPVVDTGGNSFVFLADSAATTLVFKFDGPAPDRGFFRAYRIDGAPYAP